MNDIFKTINVQGHELDIYGTKEEPLFLAVDVSKMIDYSVGNTSHMLDSIDTDEKLIVTILRAGQRREMWFLTEYGFYEVLMQSRKPIARRFKNAVKNILKDLRLKGEGDFEDWLTHEDPLVDEWEEYNRRTDEDIEFSDYLKQYKGYTDDML